jgi:hypothetical protein
VTYVILVPGFTGTRDDAWDRLPALLGSSTARLGHLYARIRDDAAAQCGRMRRIVRLSRLSGCCGARPIQPFEGSFRGEGIYRTKAERP